MPALVSSASLLCVLRLLVCCGPGDGDATAAYHRDETIHDRITRITPELVREIPPVPRWCDRLKLNHRKIDVGDCKLFCEIEGSGTPIVLISGGPGSSHHGFHPEFSRAAKFAQVIYYDQRGVGLSDFKPGDGYTLEQATNDLDKLREALGLDRWIVLGHSYGGFLGQYYAVRYPDRVDGLILVGATPAINLGKLGNRQWTFMSREEVKRISEIYDDESIPDPVQIYNAHLNGDWKRQNYYRPTQANLAMGPLYEWVHDEGFNSVLSAQADEIDLAGAFDGCPFPILLLEGKWDLTWGETKAKRFQAAIPGSKLVVFEKSAHSPFDDEPERFFNVLRDFVQKTAAANVPAAARAAWREHTKRWRQPIPRTLDHRIQRLGWGMRGSRQIAKDYSPDWLDRLQQRNRIMRVGLALYDVKRYEEALTVFQHLEQFGRAQKKKPTQAVALIWQGHMLDLLGQREKAIQAYQCAVTLDIKGWQESHGAYGLSYAPTAYAAEHIRTPFVRVENKTP